MKLIRGYNCHLLLFHIIILCSFLPDIVCYAQTSMPDYDRLNPIASIINAPTDVALDASENVYIVESSNHRLLIFSQSGQYKNSHIGFSTPICVAVDGIGRIYVGDKAKGTVEVYDLNLNFLHKLGFRDWEFSQPNDIAISGTGRVYVVDKLSNTVKIYNTDGSYYTYFGSSGNGDGEFHNPTSIAIDESAEELLVLDHQLEQDSYGGWIEGARIQAFDMSGGFKRSFTKYGQNVVEGEMFRPQHVTVDSRGRLYVTDSFHSVVFVYDSSGMYLGAVYDLSYPMTNPMGITIGKSNRLYIAALSSKKIEIYGIDQYSNMKISPLSLVFQGMQYGNIPVSQNAEIRNNGTKILDWTASTDDNWITLSDISGSLDASSAVNLGIGINMAGLSQNIYTGAVNIISDSGASEEITVTLDVLSNPPIAYPGGGYSAIEGQSIMLNASNSSGGLVRYEWDVNYNGISDSYEYNTTSATQSHVYASQGTYSIKLRITDQGNNTDEAITSAEISDSIPSADFEGNPVNGPEPLTVNFINTSTGYDQPLSYEWDFNYDGIVDSTEQNPIHSYDDLGIYSVKLTVTDSDGSINTLNRLYYVTVTSEVCPNLPVRIAGAIPEYFNTLQEAYNSAAEGDTIQSRAIIFTENPDLNLNKTVRLEGGYDCDYLSSAGGTSINGTMNISDGTVTIENFILN